MTDLPDPMTPPDCDLRGSEYMPLHGHKLFSSTLYSESTDAEFRAALRLWWSAWQQCPAGSLPNSDAALALAADYGRDVKGWQKVKKIALHGFVLCSDGRLYHPVLCEVAINSFSLRLRSDLKRDADRERLQRWRDARKKRIPHGDGNGRGNGDETRFTAVSETADETHVETPSETGTNAVEEKKKRREEGSTPKPPRGRVSDEDPAFAEFWAGYPRKDDKGHARSAWARALRKASAEEIVAGLRRYRFRDEPQFMPLPATWLNGERWLHPGTTAASAKESPTAWIDDLVACDGTNPSHPTFDLELTANDHGNFDLSTH